MCRCVAILYIKVIKKSVCVCVRVWWWGGGGGRILALLLLEFTVVDGIMVADVDRTSDERQLSLM